MRKHLYLLLMLMPLLPVYGDNSTTTCKLRGTVRNEEGKTLSLVQVTVNGKNGKFGASSNTKGRYEIVFEATDSVTVTFSRVGYETMTANMKAEKEKTLDIVLKEKVKSLGEVVVTAEHRTVEDDYVSYIPTQRQVNNANSGVGLLFNLMIPQLDVNKMGGQISTVDGTSIGLYIDGRDASLDEIMRLRPKDIKKVEYHHNPTGVFRSQGTQRALNYIVRKYDYGGYVDMRGGASFINKEGYNGMVQTSVDHKRLNFTVAARGNYSKYEDISTSETTEHLALNRNFDVKTKTHGYYSESHGESGLFRMAYNAPKTYAAVQANLSFSETPIITTRSSKTYSPEIYQNANTYQRTYSRGMQPSVYAAVQHRFSDTQNLTFQFNYIHGGNTYRSNYTEGSLAPILRNNKETVNDIDSKLNFSQIFKKGHMLGLLLWYRNAISRADYDGTIKDSQKLSVQDILFYPTYRHVFSKSFNISLQLGFDINSYYIKGFGRKTKIWPRPRMDGNWRLNKNSNINFGASMGTTKPQMSTMNTAEQRTNEYTVIKGNPDLKTGKLFEGNLSYSVYQKRWALTAYAYYQGMKDYTKTHYTARGEDLVKQSITDGSWHAVNYGLSGTINFFNGVLKLKPSVYLSSQFVTGMISDEYHRLNYNCNLFYSIGNFSISGYFYAKSKTISQDMSFFEGYNNYGVTASWGYKGLYAELSLQNIFTAKDMMKSYYNHNHSPYSFYSKIYQDNRTVSLSISYNFDFGRKIQKQNVDTGSQVQSGMLKE